MEHVSGIYLEQVENRAVSAVGFCCGSSGFFLIEIW